VKVLPLLKRYNISIPKQIGSVKVSSRRYQQTLNRQQEMLLPVRVEDYVSKHNTVRAIDAYANIALESLSLRGLAMERKIQE